MATQTREQGRYLGGRPPYGYRLADAGPHPNEAHAAWGWRAHRPDPDPQTRTRPATGKAPAHTDRRRLTAAAEFRRGPVVEDGAARSSVRRSPMPDGPPAAR